SLKLALQCLDLRFQCGDSRVPVGRRKTGDGEAPRGVLYYSQIQEHILRSRLNRLRRNARSENFVHVCQGGGKHMAKKRDSDRKDRNLQGEKTVSRRDFVKGGAAGVGAAVLSTSGTALAQVSPVTAIQWNYEADVVIIGGRCTGLPAAIRPRDLGASVIVVDQNFDPGGKMLHSGGQVSFGGGDPLQLRDIAGENDREGFVTAPRRQSVEELTEDTDFLFRDHT